MILYLVKSVSCALFFLTVYHFLIEKDKVLRFKRFFLLGILVFSLVIPIVGIPQIPESFSPVEEVVGTYIVDVPDNFVEFADIQQQPVGVTFSWIYVMAGIYLLVVSILLARFIFNLLKLIKMTRCHSAVRKYGKIHIIMDDGLDISFSFFNYIFISKNDYLDENVRNEILIHELVHVKQKHSADVLFVELLIVFFWFNPALYMYKRAIKLNHEFLADEGVINSTGNIPAYQKILIDRATRSCVCSFASSLTYLITKKRLIMMVKTTTKRNFLFKLIVLIPAFLIAGGVFSAKMIAGTNVDTSMDIIINQPFSTADGGTIMPRSGVSQEKMDEYSSIVSKYLGEITDEKVSWKSFEISKEDELILYPAYIQMTKEQRRKHLIAFISPFTPLKLRSPNVDEWKKCLSRAEIWLDGKLIDSKTANTYDRKSIVFFLSSNKKGKSYMWTRKGYEDYMNQYGKLISLDELLKLPSLAGFSIINLDKSKPVNNGSVSYCYHMDPTF